jgi:hypothetical protein
VVQQHLILQVVQKIQVSSLSSTTSHHPSLTFTEDPSLKSLIQATSLLQMASFYSTSSTVDACGERKRDYTLYDGNRPTQDRHSRATRECDCGQQVESRYMYRHRKNDDGHIKWQHNKNAEECWKMEQRSKEEAADLELQSQLIIQSTLPYFCLSKPVPSVMERIDQDWACLRALVEKHGKTEQWKDNWLITQRCAIGTRHEDPTRGPSLVEFEEYRRKQQEKHKQHEDTIKQLRAELAKAEAELAARDVVPAAETKQPDEFFIQLEHSVSSTNNEHTDTRKTGKKRKTIEQKDNTWSKLDKPTVEMSKSDELKRSVSSNDYEQPTDSKKIGKKRR